MFWRRRNNPSGTIKKMNIPEIVAVVCIGIMASIAMAPYVFSTFEIAEANKDDETIKTETDEERYGPLK